MLTSGVGVPLDKWIYGTWSSFTTELQNEVCFAADSGSMIHAFPATWVRQFDVVPVSRRELVVRAAGGAVPEHLGEIMVELSTEKETFKLRFELWRLGDLASALKDF